MQVDRSKGSERVDHKSLSSALLLLVLLLQFKGHLLALHPKFVLWPLLYSCLFFAFFSFCCGGAAGLTALHEAVRVHGKFDHKTGSNIDSKDVIRLLVSHGATLNPAVSCSRHFFLSSLFCHRHECSLYWKVGSTVCSNELITTWFTASERKVYLVVANRTTPLLLVASGVTFFHTTVPRLLCQATVVATGLVATSLGCYRPGLLQAWVLGLVATGLVCIALSGTLDSWCLFS